VLLGLANWATATEEEEAETFVGLERLGAELCMSDRAIRRAVTALGRQGLVKTTRRRRQDGTYTTTTYTLPTGQDDRREESTGHGDLSTGHGDRKLASEPPVMVTGQEPQELPTPKLKHPQALAPRDTRRARDLIFEMLFALDTGEFYTPDSRARCTKRELAAINAAAAEIRATGIFPADLNAAIQAWPSVMGDATCTANAVAKHLGRLRAASDGRVMRARQPSEQDRMLAELARRREERREARA
jgi:hypothetical protein